MKRKKLVLFGLICCGLFSQITLAKSPPSDSTSSIVVIKSVKVDYNGNSFWLVYDSVSEVIALSEKGFRVLKTSKKIFNLDKKSFWNELLHSTVVHSSEAGIRWLELKVLKLP